MLTKIGYKVLYSYRNCLWSCVGNIDHMDLIIDNPGIYVCKYTYQYFPNEIVHAPDGKPFFVFNCYKNAINWIGRAHNMEIWECEYEPASKDDVTKVAKEFIGPKIPRGTVFAASVKLYKRST